MKHENLKTKTMRERHEIEGEIVVLEARLARLREELRERGDFEKSANLPVAVSVGKMLSPQAKISLFRKLFRGREDVFAVRFESRKTGKSGYQPFCGNEWRAGVCGKPQTKCAACPSKKFVPLSDEIIRQHLVGKNKFGKAFVAGIYPLMEDEKCFFLAADFDDAAFREEALAYAKTCRENGVFAVIERSRSGTGAHVWIFFEQAIPAWKARRLGLYFLTRAMEQSPNLSFKSYDRFFPNQDTLPRGGFGNLIALPLQAEPRARGNSVFVDDDFLPAPCPWEVLQNVVAVAESAVDKILGAVERPCDLLGVPNPIEEESEALVPAEKNLFAKRENLLATPFTDELRIVSENQIFIEKRGIPPRLRVAILRLAAFQNPEFLKAQRMRLPVYNKPRIICCSEENNEKIALPRGCFSALKKLLSENKIRFFIEDKRNAGTQQNFVFTGTLRENQAEALEKMSAHDAGVLSASTAFGKTVLAAAMIARRKTSTLVLVHRRTLLAQWQKSLAQFLSVPADFVGTIGGGKKQATGTLDVAMIQSLGHGADVDSLVGNYGFVIVDECHHLSAFSFEKVLKACRAKFFLGLSATVRRQDGHHPIIFMQCGPVRFCVSDKEQVQARPFAHRVFVRTIESEIPALLNSGDTNIAEIYHFFCVNPERNKIILDDLRSAVAEGRSPIVLTERTEHIDVLKSEAEKFVRHVIVLQGRLSAKKRAEAIARLESVPPGESCVIIATGKYVGEGFDCARLDTLFLVLPVSWSGTISQYVGRLHRFYDGKNEVRVYDYVDVNLTVARRMFSRRQAAYRKIGYSVDFDFETRLF